MSQGPGTGEPYLPRGGRDAGSLPSVRGAMVLLLAVAVLYILGGFPLQILLGEPGLLLAQLLFMGLPVVAFVRLRGHDPTATLSLRLFSGRQLAAGILLLSGGSLIALFLAWFQSVFMPVPAEYLEAMADMLTADSPLRFVWLLLLVAAMPALVEELVFRGVLLSALRTRLPALGAVALCGLVFGLFHVAPQTGFRILPTAWLGMVLAWVVVVSGSLPLAALLHFLNNGTLLALAAFPPTRHMVAGTEGGPPLLLLPVALLLFAGGARVLAGGAGEPADGDLRSPRAPPSP